MCAINKQEDYSQDSRPAVVSSSSEERTTSSTMSILNEMVRDLERRTTELTRENSQLRKTLQSLEEDVDDSSGNDDDHETDSATVASSSDDHFRGRQTWAAMKTDSVSCLWNDDTDDDDATLLGTNRLQSKLLNNALRSSQERKLRKSIWGRIWGSDALLRDSISKNCTGGDDNNNLNEALAELKRSHRSSSIQ